ncbi:MAG: hypothetical protein RBT41_07540 [Clostridia bacterium]|jgi:hypothetical protein|nr:hypothetical protein [Clostridia bacterium]
MKQKIFVQILIFIGSALLLLIAGFIDAPFTALSGGVFYAPLYSLFVAAGLSLYPGNRHADA